VRRHRAKKKAEKELPEVVEEYKQVKKQLTAAKNGLREVKKRSQELLEAMEKAPTPAAQRKVVLGMITESGLNPLKELLDMAKNKTGKNALPADKRRDLLLKLLEYQAPKPKSIDVQADVSSSVTIEVMDYSKTSRAMLEAEDQETIDLPEDAAYDEFLSPEQIANREKAAKAATGPANQAIIDAVVQEEMEGEE